MKNLLFLSVIFSLIVFNNCSSDDPEVTVDDIVDEIVKYDLTVIVSPTEGGTVSYQSGPFIIGTKVTLTASPNEFYSFKEWTGAFNGVTNPMELIMNSDNSVTAVFELLDTDGDGVTDDLDTCAD